MQTFSVSTGVSALAIALAIAQPASAACTPLGAGAAMVNGQAVLSPPLEPTPPERAILERAAATIRTLEPDWLATAGTCSTCPKLVPEQQGLATTSWQFDSPMRRVVHVLLYRIASAKAAADWMKRNQSHSDGNESRTPNDFADGAYTVLGRTVPGYQVVFRKGLFVAFIKDGSKEDLQRFARYVLDAIVSEGR